MDFNKKVVELYVLFDLVCSYCTVTLDFLNPSIKFNFTIGTSLKSVPNGFKPG
jgi:hypothetical protein